MQNCARTGAKRRKLLSHEAHPDSCLMGGPSSLLSSKAESLTICWR